MQHSAQKVAALHQQRFIQMRYFAPRLRSISGEAALRSPSDGPPGTTLTSMNARKLDDQQQQYEEEDTLRKYTVRKCLRIARE